jgi:hypothetical protein
VDRSSLQSWLELELVLLEWLSRLGELTPWRDEDDEEDEDELAPTSVSSRSLLRERSLCDCELLELGRFLSRSRLLILSCFILTSWGRSPCRRFGSIPSPPTCLHFRKIDAGPATRRCKRGG